MVTPDSHRVCAPWYLGIWLRCIQILLTRLSRSLVCLSRQFNYLYTIPYCQSRNPPVLHRSLDCSLSLAATYGISVISFLPLLRCFSSRRSPLTLARGSPAYTGVSPFGHRRITASWQLPDVYRDHVRPSSAPAS